GTGAEFHFLDDYLLLLEFRFMQPLALAVLEFAKIHDTANGWNCRRCNFHQIQLSLFGKLVGCRDANHTNLLTASTNKPDFWSSNFSVDACFFFLCYAITP